MSSEYYAFSGQCNSYFKKHTKPKIKSKRLLWPVYCLKNPKIIKNSFRNGMLSLKFELPTTK